jgi:hypothetical protein
LDEREYDLNSENTPIVTDAKVIIGGILAVAGGDRCDDRRVTPTNELSTAFSPLTSKDLDLKDKRSFVALLIGA